MPWFEPCASNGYTKFLTNPQLRDNKWIVSDNYLQSLLLAYRQGYINAGGPDYEDSDDRLLNTLAEACIGSTSDAAALGRDHAARDIRAGQDAHPQSLSPGGVIPATPATGAIPPVIQTVAAVDTNAGVVYSNPQGQPGENPTFSPSVTYGGPSIASGPANAGQASGFALPKLPWLLIGAAAVAFYVLTKKG
jgi:hypothetical protein